MEKKREFSLTAIHFRPLLIIILVVMSFVPGVIYGRVLLGSFGKAEIEERKISLQSQALILSNNLMRSAYFASGEKNEGLDRSIDNFADIYSGRIVIVNKDFRIVKDTFNIAGGKINVAEEVLRCFRGENTSKYIEGKNYIIQTTPIYAGPDNKDIEGVILVTSSTEGEFNILNNTSEQMLMLEITIFAVVFGLSIIIAVMLTRPFKNLREDLQKISEGDMDQELHINQYTVTRDISDTINATYAKLRALDQSRDEFVANVSHELKTPITSIRVLADSINSMEEAPVELYQEFMKDISDEIDREAKIIDDLLSLVKLDKAADTLNTEQVDINALLEQILKRIKPIALKRNIEVTLESIRDVVAEVDETKLSLALNNLVENAVKYNNEKGWVKVVLDADHKFFYVKVSDSGVGIPEEFQDMVFERFYRVDKARSRETGGTGLGLAITKNIILRHKGIIKVTSKEGEGSTFSIRIPLKYIKEEKPNVMGKQRGEKNEKKK